VTTTAAQPLADTTGRFELLRALAATTVVAPPLGLAITEAAGLPAWSPELHTRVFVLELPPYASIHLGQEGKLGGEAADRVAGTWRALGLVPPADADHLGTLLAFYAHLGEASVAAATDAARSRLAHAAAAVLFEHIWSWAPGYLDAASDYPGADRWAGLLLAALRREVEHAARATSLPAGLPAGLPAALRLAPAPLTGDIGYPELLDALVTPVRTGFVLTQGDLSDAAGALGVGRRRGERRYVLSAMIEQDPAAVLSWLSAHALRSAGRHRRNIDEARETGNGADDVTTGWWAERAASSATVLASLAAACH